MQWWQYLIISVVTVCLGAFLGYWFNRRGMESERATIEARALESAILAIFAEVEANKEIASRPFTGKQLPFLTEMWNLYKGHIDKLPEEIAQPIHKLYIDIIHANAIVSYDLHKLPYGSGYLDDQYKGMCSEIAKQAALVIESLTNMKSLKDR